MNETNPEATLKGKAVRRFNLIVFNIEKAHNVGMLMRTAYALGCHEVLVIGRRRFKLTGHSHTARIQKWRHFHTLEEAVAYCKIDGFRICGIEIGGEWIHQAEFAEDTAFILGNEGKGLVDAQRFCERIVSIPQWGGVPSMNVAVAGAIVMYEFQKRQGLETAPVNGQHFYDTNYDP